MSEDKHSIHGAKPAEHADPPDTPPEEQQQEDDDEEQKDAPRWHKRFANWYKTHKKLSIPLTVLLILVILLAVPFTRYKTLGLVIKKDFKVGVVDDVSGKPVSSAQISAGGASAVTDGNGKAVLHLPLGKYYLTFEKKYYKSTAQPITVDLVGKRARVFEVKATGRQVKIVVKNAITKQALPGVSINIADITAKTDKKGEAVIVLPAGLKSVQANLSLKGFNNASRQTVNISDTAIQENDLTLTPAGKVYFLSRLSGKIDVVKTNLDGGDRQTVLSGTGKEDQSNTVLLASRDWKYLALLSRRQSNQPLLYLIDTSNGDKVTFIDGDDSVSVTPVGWSGNAFVYTVNKDSTDFWQPGQQTLKSYSVISKKIVTLDQNAATGSSNSDYARENFGQIYADTEKVYYAKSWVAAAGNQLNDKQATFNEVKSDGSGKRVIRSFGIGSNPQATGLFLETNFVKPDTINLLLNDGSQEKFYDYANGAVKDGTSLNDSNFYSSTLTYLYSPSGNQTFWSDPRDGKNTLFIGDDEGNNGKQINTLSEYAGFGWFTDDYLLVSKNSSELYIMPKAGYTKDNPPLKISDYHKPAQNFAGYGGGYGGL